MNEPSFKTLEMGYTIAEFQKTLKGQFIHNTGFSLKEINPQEWTIRIEQDTSVDIVIAESMPRQIAMLVLPVLKIDFKFHNASILKQKAFMKTFFKYFHKGGG